MEEKGTTETSGKMDLFTSSLVNHIGGDVTGFVNDDIEDPYGEEADLEWPTLPDLDEIVDNTEKLAIHTTIILVRRLSCQMLLALDEWQKS